MNPKNKYLALLEFLWSQLPSTLRNTMVLEELAKCACICGRVYALVPKAKTRRYLVVAWIYTWVERGNARVLITQVAQYHELLD